MLAAKRNNQPFDYTPIQQQAWSISAFDNLLSHKDFGTKGHSDRLLHLVTAFGRKVGLSSSGLVELRLFAKFHDLGKVLIPDKILFKEEALSVDEWKIMKMHSEIGAQIAASIKELQHISHYIYHHHEHWDGSGYPEGITGLEIPLPCRILSIADAWDAMINDRPYRKALSYQDAAEEIKRCAGTQFDPTLIDIWRSL